MNQLYTRQGFMQNCSLLHLREKVAEGRMRGKCNGFTLVELLVVVLIIGILAAVAVPQYQKAVWRSRNVQLKQIAVALGQAQQAYYLANGTYAKTFNQLDIEIKGLNSARSYRNGCAAETYEKNDSVRYNDDFQLLLSTSGNIYVNWISGPYTCAGFQFNRKTAKLYCVERINSAGQGEFCKKIEKATYNSTPTTWAIYNLPN